MPVIPLDESHRALIERLGAIAYRWAYVDFMQGELFSFVLQADPGRMHIITKNVSSSSVTEWLRVLSPFQFTHPETQAGLTDLFSRIDRARTERNVYIHGLWSAGPEPETADVMTLRWERAEIMKRELVTLDDLDSLLHDIGEIHDELVWLGNQLGFHPSGGQSPEGTPATPT
jgi:hypothetical protein